MDEIPPKDAFIIPTHESAVRRMFAGPNNLDYKAYGSLEEARADSDSAMILEADSGGQILATCPVPLIKASYETLFKLLMDLEWITWGPAYLPMPHHDPLRTEASIYFEHSPVGSVIGGGMGGGRVINGVWTHAELQEFNVAEFAEQVITGKRKSLLPSDTVDRNLKTFAAAKHHEDGRVVCNSAVHNNLEFFNASMCRVAVDEPTLLEIARMVDQWPELSNSDSLGSAIKNDPILNYDFISWMPPVREDIRRGGELRPFDCKEYDILYKKLNATLEGDEPPSIILDESWRPPTYRL